MPPVARAELVTAELLRGWPLPSLDEARDKTDRGDVHVVGGSVSTAGAVLLAGVAALRVGAGRLTVTTVEQTAVALSVAMPEAMVVGLPDDSGSLTRCRLEHEPDAVVIGPGITEPGELVASVLDSCGQAAAVIDAVALRDLPDRLPARTVLTPNTAELNELGGDACVVSRRRGAVVVTQGWVAAPDGRLWQDEQGSIALGTSGSGDVLAGIVGGLLARGADPAQAGVWGQYLHGRAALELGGRVGLLASDLLEVLPGLVERLSH
jgi:hydroxyethylthiazole kinase-like uncharacterized protein yjeF